jgi:cytidine deaminase
LTICAERVAIFNAVSAGNRMIEKIALSCIDAAPGSPPALCMPCGACRQVMAEFAGGNLPVVIDGVGERSLSDLLPEPFKLEQTKS